MLVLVLFSCFVKCVTNHLLLPLVALCCPALWMAPAPWPGLSVTTLMMYRRQVSNFREKLNTRILRPKGLEGDTTVTSVCVHVFLFDLKCSTEWETYLIFGFWWRRASDAPWRCFRSHKTRPAPWQGPEGWNLSLKNQQQHKHQEKSHADVCWGSFKVSNTTGYQFLHSMNIHNAVFLIMCLRRFG